VRRGKKEKSKFRPSMLRRVAARKVKGPEKA